MAVGDTTLDDGHAEDDGGEEIDRQHAEEAMYPGGGIEDIADRDADHDTEDGRDLEGGHHADAALLIVAGDIGEEAEAGGRGTGGRDTLQQPPTGEDEHEDDLRDAAHLRAGHGQEGDEREDARGRCAADRG